MLIVMLITLLASTDCYPPEPEHSVTYMGGTIGIPALAGIALETEISGSARMGFHAGSMIIMNSLGARIILGGTGPGWKFRYFAGAAAFINGLGEFVDYPNGISEYGWCGAGIDWNRNKWRLTLETGLLIGGSREGGFGYSGLTPAFGISLLYVI